MLIAAFLAAFLACVPHQTTGASAVSTPKIGFRPVDSLTTLGPEARVDRGLRTACEELALAANHPDARLTPGAVRLAAERAGFPGVARFMRVSGTAELPEALLAEIPRGQPVDVGWAWRDFPDGRRWWVLGWAPRRLLVDDLPRSVPLGGGVGIRVEGGVSPRLFVASPAGAVKEYDLHAGSTRWVGGLDRAGAWRFEVVDGDRVELLFSVFAGGEFPPLTALPAPVPLDEPVAAAARLYAAVDGLRAVNGLPALAPLPAFEPLVREQAACIALGGEALHRTDLCPGFAARATERFFPRGRFRENVAIATTGAEAWDALLSSPGHVANLLCADCTHIAIGAAAEPIQDGRLFFVWELMTFPDGEPRPRRKW